MNTLGKLNLMLLATGLLAGCMASTAPTPTAFQRNVGPGSTVTGVPNDGMGTMNGGESHVPGVSSAGPVNK